MKDLGPTPLEGARMPDHTEDLTEDEAAQLGRLRVVMGFIDESELERRVIDGRYEVIRHLGRGGMGIVYRVHDRKLEDDNLALKLVRSRDPRDGTRLRAKLEQEARAMAKLRDHLNVVRLYDVGVHDGSGYFTMEYIEGRDLRRWCEDHRTNREEILRVYVAAGRGLEAAHEIGIVHRDFKPENVLVSEAGIAKVVDFGIAAVTAALAADGATTLPGSDEPTWVVAGTRPYMPPEQRLGERPDARSDQFAFCVSLWWSLCGVHPYSWRTWSEQDAALDKPPRGGEGLPRWLRRLLLRGMSKQRSDRFRTMGDLLEQIERHLARPRMVKRIAMFTAACLVIAGAAAFAVFMLQPKPTPPQTCDDFVDDIAEHWGEPQRRSLSARASESPEAVRYALDRLDALGQSWSQAARQACVDEEAPAPDTQPRECLDRWLLGLDQTVDLLVTRGDARTLTAAPDLLEHLVAPGGDFCAFADPRIEDLELVRLVDAARNAAIVGDEEIADQLSQDAIVRANQLAAHQTHTREQAQAHAVRGEVLARRYEYESAFDEYRNAQEHALVTGSDDVLVAMLILWAKGLALSNDPVNARLAHAYLVQVESLLDRLRTPDDSMLRGEQLEALALADEFLGNFERAKARYRESEVFFREAGYPILAARSIFNGGALEHRHDNFIEAEVAYRRGARVARSRRRAAKLPVFGPGPVQPRLGCSRHL